MLCSVQQGSPGCIGHLADIAIGQLVNLAIGQVANFLGVGTPVTSLLASYDLLRPLLSIDLVQVRFMSSCGRVLSMWFSPTPVTLQLQPSKQEARGPTQQHAPARHQSVPSRHSTAQAESFSRLHTPQKPCHNPTPRWRSLRPLRNKGRRVPVSGNGPYFAGVIPRQS